MLRAEPFTIDIPDEVLDDLRARIARTKWPEPLPAPGWAAGVDLAYLRDLVGYWATSFDWRAQERYLNSFPQFTADLDGMTIHFVHQRGRGPHPFPLVLTHGWPSSFVELLRLVPLLTDPAAHGGDAHDAFDVVVPSLPGYAFSGRPAKSGLCTLRSIGALWARLMTSGLGYTRFGAQGQDIGAGVTLALGADHADLVSGIHLPGLPPIPPAGRPLTEADQVVQAAQDRWFREEAGYAIQQGTYPQTLACGLTDSPAGLAAWILDKVRGWSDCDGEVERRFTKDQLLTNITIYWVTGSIGSSFLFYYEARHHPEGRPAGRVGVPVGVAHFAKESGITAPRA